VSIKVEFTTAEGDRVSATGKAGESLLYVGQNAGMPLEGTCEGQMACSTCHVLIAREWLDKLPAPVVEEEDMLDLAAGARANSRLACQIVLAEDLNGLEVTIPPDAHDMSSIR